LLVTHIPLGYSADQNLVESPVAQVSWSPADDDAHVLKLEKTYGRLPMHFEVNEGQTDAQVEFLSRGRGYTLFLTADEAVLALSKPAHAESEIDSPLTKDHGDVTNTSVGDVLRMRLIDANPTLQVVGLEQLPGKVNYLTGNDRAEWRTDIATYAKVKYERVYEGIDLLYYGNQRQLEYDFIVAPGTDPGVLSAQ